MAKVTPLSGEPDSPPIRPLVQATEELNGSAPAYEVINPRQEPSRGDTEQGQQEGRLARLKAPERRNSGHGHGCRPSPLGRGIYKGSVEGSYKGSLGFRV